MLLVGMLLGAMLLILVEAGAVAWIFHEADKDADEYEKSLNKSKDSKDKYDI